MRSLIKEALPGWELIWRKQLGPLLAPLMLHCVIEDVSLVKDRKSQDAG